MKKRYVLYFLGILAICFFTVRYYSVTSKLKKIEIEIDAIDKVTLGNYFDTFILIKSFDAYNKQDFLDYLKNQNESLLKEINMNYIEVQSIQGLDAIYHKGMNGEDDMLNGDDKSIYISLVDKKIKKGWLYTIKGDSIIPLHFLNVNKMIAKTVPCDELKKVKYKLDTTYPKFDTLLVNKGLIKFSENLNDDVSNLIRKDSLLKAEMNRNKYLFSIFSNDPIENFYCDE